jgi:CRP-like cAMP-binding protein
MSDDDRASRLRVIPLFSRLEPDALGWLAGIAAEVDIVPGQVLVQPRAPGSGLFVVEQGTVVVERAGRPDVELGPGECFGELALLTDEGLRTARVRARTEGRCLAIPRREFVGLLREQPSVAIMLLSTLARRLAESSAG